MVFESLYQRKYQRWEFLEQHLNITIFWFFHSLPEYPWVCQNSWHMVTKTSFTDSICFIGSKIRVRADKGLNRRKVEPLSARTFIMATFFLVHTEVLEPQTWQTYQWKANSDWGRTGLSNILINKYKTLLERHTWWFKKMITPVTTEPLYSSERNSQSGMVLKQINVFSCLGGDILDYLNTNTCRNVELL